MYFSVAIYRNFSFVFCQYHLDQFKVDATKFSRSLGKYGLATSQKSLWGHELEKVFYAFDMRDSLPTKSEVSVFTSHLSLVNDFNGKEESIY